MRGVTMDQKKADKEISSIIASALKNHQEVQIKKLGTFKVEHRNQQQEQDKSGRVFLTPPADIITFLPEK